MYGARSTQAIDLSQQHAMEVALKGSEEKFPRERDVLPRACPVRGRLAPFRTPIEIDSDKTRARAAARTLPTYLSAEATPAAAAAAYHSLVLAASVFSFVCVCC